MKIASFAMFASLSLGGCASTLPPDILPASNATDATMGIRDVRPGPVVVDYNHRDPVDPTGWRRPPSQPQQVPPGSGAAS